jgi:hypothetical protein
MATKSDLFRYEAERAGVKRAKKPRPPARNSPVDTSLPGVSATDRRVGGGSSGTRNLSARAGRKAVYALEDSATGRPSRKSTRRAANRQKNDQSFRAKRRNAWSRK